MATAPSVIGRYQIRARLGEGGMGVVYLAHDPAMDSDIAIKVLRSAMADEDLRKRFAREAQMARRVGIHPNVVTIFDIGEHDGDPYIAMEYVSGQTLEHVIRRQALPSPTRRLHIVEDVCTGLTHAHRAGLVHRDIKPANVMLKDDGTVKILDFGIARVAESDLTADGMVIGALNYMSPEQMTGSSSLDARSDVFAVGALFYELLSGRRAFPGSIREGLPYRIIHGMPPPLSEVVADLDPEIERIILRALEKDPAKRYQDVGTMRQEIARVRRRLEHAQIERAITDAREAFDTGDYAAVVASCAEITSLDPDEPRALDLLQRAESARTGEHADTAAAAAAAAAMPASERPTIALPVPVPASTSGVTVTPPTTSTTATATTSTAARAAALTGAPIAASTSAPAAASTATPTGTLTAAPTAAATRPETLAPPIPVPVSGPAPFVAAPVVAAPRKSASILLPVTVATLAIAALVAVGVFAWTLGRSGSSRAADAPAASARAAVPSVAQPSLSQPIPVQPPASASNSPQTPTSAPTSPLPLEATTPSPASQQPSTSTSAPALTSSPSSGPGPTSASMAASTPTPTSPLKPTPTQGAPDSSPASRTPIPSPLPASTPTSQVRGSQVRGISAPTHPASSSSASATAPAPSRASTPASATTSAPAPAAPRPAAAVPTAPAAQPAATDPEPEPEPTRARVVPLPQDEPAAARPDDSPYRRYGRPYGTRSRDGARDPRGADSRYRGESSGRYGGRVEPSNPEGEIRRAMRTFQTSWDRLDVEGMRRVFPGFLGGPNQPYRNYTIEFDDMRVFVNGTQGSVHTLVRQTLRSGMGGRARPTQVIFRFEQRSDGRWIINGMQRTP
jgi:predicted Ser/Thr protein kinase